MNDSRKKNALYDRVDGFNVVNAWFTPDDDLILLLSHRNTNDSDVLIRVDETDIILVDEEVDSNFDAWEDKSTRLGRLNTGGNWDESNSKS